MQKEDFPEALQNLPVAKSLMNGDIQVDGSFAMIAHTGSGKTMIIPAIINIQTGRKVILRQPTRQTTRSVYLGLKHFWGNKLKIGMHTSEIDEGKLENCDIMVVTDGVMKTWLKNIQTTVTVVFDEYHSQMPVTEIEAGIVKTYLKEGLHFDIVFLSATIRPENILHYFEDLNDTIVSPERITELCDVMEYGGEAINAEEQNQWLRLHYSEGVAYPIDEQITYYNEYSTIPKFCKRMLDEKKRGLVFLCTRAEIQNKCNDMKRVMPKLPVEFAHADISIDDIIKFVDKENPCVVFATVALATSMTLPFDEVLIVDKGIDSVYENGIQKQLTGIPIDNNGVLQRRGRVGRIKPGVATLSSTFRDTWKAIKPTAITPPLEKVSPDQVVMTCAQYEVDARGIDIMSNLNGYDIEISVEKLRRLGLIYKEEETLKLTVHGKRVNALPLEVDIAVMVANCPTEILPIIIAIASCDQGIYGLFQNKIATPEEKTIHGIEIFDKEMFHDQSILIMKAKIIQNAIKARKDDKTTLPQFARSNGLWPKRLEKILFKFYQICTRGLKKSERIIRQAFIELDIDAHAEAVIEYIKKLHVFEPLNLHYDDYREKMGYKGEYLGYFTIMDGLDITALRLKDRKPDSIVVLGRPKIIKTKKGGDMCIWSDTTILDETKW